MGDVLPFKKIRASERHKGNTLCRNGHHKWKLDQSQVFDVKQGRLVSRYHCRRCGATRNQAE
ncbi:hypothetical protein [Sedimenticola sp.]|uniref:hypothetical protein n=1 Tax=Sedimenticola sp. TaxID=1940285 RepID=UPI003D101550